MLRDELHSRRLAKGGAGTVLGAYLVRKKQHAAFGFSEALQQLDGEKCQIAS
jgi:hypothetical protein